MKLTKNNVQKILYNAEFILSILRYAFNRYYSNDKKSKSEPNEQG